MPSTSVIERATRTATESYRDKLDSYYMDKNRMQVVSEQTLLTPYMSILFIRAYG